MVNKYATRDDVLRHLKVSGNYWEQEGCDICRPVFITELEEFIQGWDSDLKESAPWLCEEHARDLGLLW